MSVTTQRAHVQHVDHSSITPRSYQLEMVEESLKRNIIVAMDTGSGKTHIAVLRIRVELEKGETEKVAQSLTIIEILPLIILCQIIWFLAPTVALCEQQHRVIETFIPSIQTRLLTGSDNVDRWSEQRIWDAALRGIQCVVSTHAVLFEAMTHGFVRMEQLSLLIFDEAHHCARNHPANRIMQDFYHEQQGKPADLARPRILGLTASTVIRSNIKELGLIEANLNSISRTPRRHRHELMQYVHRPELEILEYRTSLTSDAVGPSLQALDTFIENFDKSASIPVKTWQDQLRRFRNTADHVFKQLGLWAAEYFISETVAKVERTDSDALAWGWDIDEASTYRTVLGQVPRVNMQENVTLNSPLVISEKVKRLISVLVGDNPSLTSGIVFVRQRATVGVLVKLLTIHPQTRDHVSCAPFVGLSNSGQRKTNIAELLDVKGQSRTLEDFREGRKNLIVATDVLEEGIDISICHLVVCFDPPANLKSFIQRRGRARERKSKYIIMMDPCEMAPAIAKWQTLEQEMIKRYQNDLREIQCLADLEDVHEDVDERLQVQSTGALITAHTALSHLFHFCAVLPRQPYTDLLPKFTYNSSKVPGDIDATVTLPNCVPSGLRSAVSRKSWKTERAASKDAAFQMYRALHRAGLVNDNLLPLNDDSSKSVADQLEDSPSVLTILEQFNPWHDWAEAWPSDAAYRTTFFIETEASTSEIRSTIVLTSPLPIPSLKPIRLYLDQRTTFVVLSSPTEVMARPSADQLQTMASITHLLLRSVHSDMNPDESKDYVAYVTPQVDSHELAAWLTARQGRQDALTWPKKSSDPSACGFVRCSLSNGSPHIFTRWCNANSNNLTEIECIPLASRRNFLHANQLSDGAWEPGSESGDALSGKTQIYSPELCTIDNLPAVTASTALLIPSIMRHIQVRLTVQKFMDIVLRGLFIKNLDHIATAICTPMAQWTCHYQRYEFLGDSILKFVVSGDLFVRHPTWHEGYLTTQRAKLISNSNLTTVALRAGLEKYVLTTSLVDRKWQLPSIRKVKSHADTHRTISSKVLADVVEALFGAAWLDGGFPAARSCIHRLIPNCPALPADFSSIIGQYAGPANLAESSVAEELTVHHFNTLGLWKEALTHPSLEQDLYTESYQRLEFLGDAVLDMVVVLAIWDCGSDLSPHQMSLIKATVVNSDFLGFLCMDYCSNRDRLEIQQTGKNSFEEEHDTTKVHIWQCMRHHSGDIVKAQRACTNRYIRLHEDIKACLHHGTQHPWALLAQIGPEKFFSDLIESVIGAIFVDTKGNLTECRRFAEQLGIVSYLKRLVADGVDVEQPVTALQQRSGAAKVVFEVKQGGYTNGLYSCIVNVGGLDIVTVTDCLTRHEARTRAADAALDMLSRS